MNPIRCIECYKQRPGGRCQFCPLHKNNRPHYHSIGDGWFIKADEPTPSHLTFPPDEKKKTK